MQRSIIAAGLAAALLVPSAAMARDVDTHRLSKYRERVMDLRERVDKKEGRRAGGLDILRWGIGPKGDRRPAKTHEVKEYEAVLRRILYPPVVLIRAPSAPSGSTLQGTAYPQSEGLGGGGPEAFVECESGGDWDAVNPSTGAYGRYQLMPMHFGPGGICEGMGKDPTSQTECANRVYDAQGSGAWAQCGG